MIRCIIVDDEPLALEVLEHFISHTPQLELVTKCGNALDAFKVLHGQQVDLMFLDIKIPGINDLDFCQFPENPSCGNLYHRFRRTRCQEFRP